MKAINPEGSTIPGISQAMRVEAGKPLFLSGHVPFLEDGSLAGPGLAAQFRQFADADLPPARALIGVAALFHPDVKVEVDAVVALEERRTNDRL